MLKPAFDALWAGVKLFDLAAIAVAIPLATASRSWLPERSWAPSVLLAIAVVLGARLGLRVLAPSRALVRARDREQRRGSRSSTVAREAAMASAVREGAAPVPGAERVMLPQPRPAGARAAAILAGGTEPDGVLDALRSRMDEVTYRPGRPNVLSMTKYVDAPGVTAPDAEFRARGEADDDVRVACSRVDDGAETVLVIAGVLDAVTAPSLRPELDALVAERRASVTVDLSSLRRIDSSGIGLLVGLLKRCRTFGGAVRIAGAKDQPLSVMRLLRLEQAFTIR